RSRLIPVGLVGLGALLGYATAAGHLSPFDRAAAAPTVTHPVASTPASLPTCCATDGARVDVSALVAHNAKVSANLQQAGKKPHICIIWGDDIGQSNVSAYSRGMMGYQTPNIDRVAKEGMMFTDYYAEQSCTAGRASFITGQHGMRTGLTKVGMPGAKAG